MAPRATRPLPQRDPNLVWPQVEMTLLWGVAANTVACPCVPASDGDPSRADGGAGCVVGLGQTLCLPVQVVQPGAVPRGRGAGEQQLRG